MEINGIYLYWQESLTTPYLLCISCSEINLKNMLKNIIEEYKKKYEINDYIFKIEPVKLYVVSKIKNENENEKILLKKVIFYKEEFIKNKIYGMNKNNLNSVDQVLLKVIYESDENSVEYQLFLEELRNNELFKNNISSNSIEYDKYYDEGILNA